MDGLSLLNKDIFRQKLYIKHYHNTSMEAEAGEEV
jgi:hypothetical protein